MSLGGGACMVTSNVSWVMVTWGPPLEQNDRHLWKYYLPATSLVDGKKSSYNDHLLATSNFLSKLSIILPHANEVEGKYCFQLWLSVCLFRGSPFHHYLDLFKLVHFGTHPPPTSPTPEPSPLSIQGSSPLTCATCSLGPHQPPHAWTPHLDLETSHSTEMPFSTPCKRDPV